MSILEFKDSIVLPIKKTIEQYKSPSLSQFKALDDVKTQWTRAEGLEMALNHIESTYNSIVNAHPSPSNEQVSDGQIVEILPPQ